MIRYLDTSAVAKVIVHEVNTLVLRAALREWSTEDLVSSMLMVTELRRLTGRLGLPASAADGVIAALEVIDLEREDYLVAGQHAPATARTLDVLHVTVAMRVGADTIVTYDKRQAEVARAAGVTVVAPGQN